MQQRLRESILLAGIAAISCFIVQGVPSYLLFSALNNEPSGSSDLYFWSRAPWVVAPVMLGVSLSLAMRAPATSDPAWRLIRPTLVAASTYLLSLTLALMIETVVQYPAAWQAALAGGILLPFLDYTLAAATLTALAVVLSAAHIRRRRGNGDDLDRRATASTGETEHLR